MAFYCFNSDIWASGASSLLGSVVFSTMLNLSKYTLDIDK